MKGSNLSWYLHRLRTMSLPEIGFRVSQQLRTQWEKRFQQAHFPAAQVKAYPKRLFDPVPLDQWEDEQCFSVFGVKKSYLDPIDWHLDIHSGRRFPLLFSRSIDTRSEKYGIVKNVWEVNRMQFLTAICFRYQQSGEEKWLFRFMELIESWIKANPYLIGVNWYSNIEVNLRLITWVLCWEILDATELISQHAAFARFVSEQWIPLIHLHLTYAHRHPSRYSSSNNHLIAEGAGLFIASAYWSFRESAQWRKNGQAILEREIQKQHSSTGVNREEASEYIQFITDFFLLAYLVGEKTGHVLSAEYRSRLKGIMGYIGDLMDQSGHVPYYGDDDDGRTFILSDEAHPNNFRSLLISGAILFGLGTLKAKGGEIDLKNRFLFGVEGMQRYAALEPRIDLPQSRFYVEEGHFLCKNGSSDKEIYLHVDAAPLGYLSIAAHGHADALSFFLHVDGKPVLADMGTYTYHSEPEWRAYFKGTLAHNTVRVDEQDQAQNAGPCLWLDHYTVELLEHSSTAAADEIIARHSGYEKLGVGHTRRYYFDKSTNRIDIEDHLTVRDGETHSFEWPFHLHPEVRIHPEGPQSWRLQAPGARAVLLHMDELVPLHLVKGQESPILGWYSPSFLQKMPTNCLYGKVMNDRDFVLRIRLQIES